MQKTQNIVDTNKIALVVGATGFIGKFLIAQLLQDNFQVIAMCRNIEQQSGQVRQWLQLKHVDDEKLQFIQGDITLPNLGLSEANWNGLKEVKFLFNSSALFAWNLSMQQAKAVNVDGLNNLLHCVHQHCQLQRAVHLSGYMLTLKAHLWEAGVNLDQIKQTHWPKVYKKLGAYEASKVEGHFTWIEQAQALNIPWTVIHPATVVGDELSGEIPNYQPVYQLIQQLISGKMVAIPATPQHYLPVVSINMLARAIRYAAQDPLAENQEILIANPTQISLQRMIELVAKSLKMKAPTRFISLSLLKFILNWKWLAEKLNMSAESLNFLRTEQLNLVPFLKFNEQWKIAETDLKQTLEQTALWVSRN